MRRLQADVEGLVEALKKEGIEPYVDDYLMADDVISHFRNEDLAKISAAEAMQILGSFVSKVRGGSRARVGMMREGGIHEIFITFDEAPKELWTIIQVADLIPGETVVAGAKEKPEESERKGQAGPAASGGDEEPEPEGTPVPAAVLVDPALRADPEERGGARAAFRDLADSVPGSRDYSVAAAIFLARSDFEHRLVCDRVSVASDGISGSFWGKATGDDHGEFVAITGERFSYRREGDEYHLRTDREFPARSFRLDRGVKDLAAELPAIHFQKYNPSPLRIWKGEDHLKAAEHLAGTLKAFESRESVAGPELVLLFALAHLSDAIAFLGAGDGAVIHAAELLGMKRSKEGNTWGPPEATEAFELFALRREGASKAAAASGRFRKSPDFTLRYAAAYFELRGLIEGREALKTFHEDLERFANSVRGGRSKHLLALLCAVERVGKCAQCEDGRILCETCKGKGRADIKCPGYGWQEVFQCPDCRGAGVLKKDARCPDCKGSGRHRCEACGGYVWFKKLPPTARLERICKEEPCAACGGTGLVFRHTTHLCAECGGFGIFLIPTEDPSAKLGRE